MAVNGGSKIQDIFQEVGEIIKKRAENGDGKIQIIIKSTGRTTRSSKREMQNM